MKLIIATPSPFARKARIALMEKQLPHDIEVQNPWQTEVGANPLGKVPALVLDDGHVVHDSGVIVEYLETLGVPPVLIPPQSRVEHRQIEALADGICDAVVLIVTERSRPAGKQSADWIARQARKIPAGLDELERRLGDRASFTPQGFGARLARGTRGARRARACARRAGLVRGDAPAAAAGGDRLIGQQRAASGLEPGDRPMCARWFLCIAIISPPCPPPRAYSSSRTTAR
jgi:glutathione S-transferase